MKVLLAVAILSLLCLTTANAGELAAGSKKTLCRADEQVYFSCSVGEKLVSLCASTDLSDRSGQLQYRFGKSAQLIDLVYPQQPTHPRNSFMEFHDSFAKGGSEALAFRIGAYSYGVFVTRSVYGYNGAGVTVSKAGKRMQLLKCRTESLVSEPFYCPASVGSGLSGRLI